MRLEGTRGGGVQSSASSWRSHPWSGRLPQSMAVFTGVTRNSEGKQREDEVRGAGEDHWLAGDRQSSDQRSH